MKNLLQAVLRSLRLAARMDWVLTTAVFLLLIVGVFFIYSACRINPHEGMRTLYRQQIVWVVIGAVCYFGFALADYRHLRRLAWPAYAASLVLLVLVLFFGTRIYGARRWLSLAGFTLQPAELAKLAFVLVMSRQLSRPGENYTGAGAVLRVLAVAVLPMLLIIKQPDLGTALVFVPVLAAMMLAAGVPYRTLGVLAGLGGTVAGAFLALLILPAALGMTPGHQAQVMKVFGLSPYQRDRIMVFLSDDTDPLGAGWNKRQSEIAVGSGGVWGKGYLKGTQNILGFLPRSVAPTDFIFSVIAEEKGFMGAMLVVGLFGIVLACGTGAAARAPDKMGRLLCVGVVTLLFCHSFVNIAMTVGLMPITGLPLPLLSYGGTFMVVVMSALGVVQSVGLRARRSGAVFEQGNLWSAGPAAGR